MNEILLVNALIAGLEVLIPRIAALVKSGSITVAEQAALHARIAALRTDAAQFTGPEWDVSSN